MITDAIVDARPHTTSPVACARRARSTWGARSSASAGSVSSIATDERLRENADVERLPARDAVVGVVVQERRASAPSGSGTRRAGRRARGRSARSGRRWAAPRGSTICRPPSKTTPTGIPGLAATRQEASMPVPSSTTATACLADRAPHVRDGARRGERGVERAHSQLVRLRRRSGCRSRSLRARRAGRRSRSCARGTASGRTAPLTTIVSGVRWDGDESPPQPASASSDGEQQEDATHARPV